MHSSFYAHQFEVKIDFLEVELLHFFGFCMIASNIQNDILDMPLSILRWRQVKANFKLNTS